MTDNERKANNAHDKLADILSYLNKVKEFHEIAKDVEAVYDEMQPMFIDILRRDT